MHREIITYNSEVVAPILFLSFASCIEYKYSGVWPQTPPSLGLSTPFSTIESKSGGGNNLLFFRLKSSNLLWSLRSASIDENDEKRCTSTIKAGRDDNSYIFRYNSAIPFSQLNKEKWEGATYDDFSKSAMEVTTIAYPVLFRAEKSRPQRTSDETEKFISFMNSVMSNIIVCAILDIEQNHCRMSSTQSTGDMEKRKVGIQKKVKKKMEEMKKELGNKLDSIEESNK